MAAADPRCNRNDTDPASYDDEAGLDNSYVLEGLDDTPIVGHLATHANHRITEGVSSVLTLEVASDGSVTGALQRSRAEGESGDTATLWHPAVQSLNGDSPLATLSGTLNGDTLELTGSGYFEVDSLMGTGADSTPVYYRLRVRAFRIHAALSRGTDGAVEGIEVGAITGVVDAVEANDAVNDVYSGLAGECLTSSPEEPVFADAADMRADGSNGDGSQACNAISIGIGFDARPVQLGDSDADVPSYAFCP